MEDISFPPKWFLLHDHDLKSNLKYKNYEHFHKFCELFKRLNEDLERLSPTVANLQIKEEVPSFLLIETKYLNFMYTYLYKLRNLSNSLKFSLDQGNFVSAVVVCRALFETTCCHCYFLNKIENHCENLNKSKKHLGEGMGLINKLLNKAIVGSSFDWNSHLNVKNGPTTVKHLHINDALRDLEKRSRKPVAKYYSILSEMVHPNFGSNTLVVHTRGRDNPDYYELILGEGKHPENLMWFLDNLAETLHQTTNLTLDAVARSNHLGAFFQSLTSKFEANKI